uniref:hypothetical protein n=1 Tax=Obesumbacterium proteus TaxID=82983 RepID=UPI002AAF7F8A|nr:hypothetical protein [Obesumbacterium proteus]
MKVGMELAYLCCARQGDVLGLTKQQLLKDGIFIEQGKAEKRQIKARSQKLMDVIALAKELPSSYCVSSLYVIHQQHGHSYTRERSISDKQKISGHKTTSQTARYDRKIEIVPVVGGQ